MNQYTSDEIQSISASFRNIARRLSRTDYNQCDSNLIRFMNFIQSNALINDFIQQNHVKDYDVKAMIENRGRATPFDVSPIKEEEISMAVQMLDYAAKVFDGDFTKLYGTYWYTNLKTTSTDEMRTFIEHIIDPLIDYIADYLQACYNKAEKDEKEKNPMKMKGITATNATIVMGSTVNGNVSNQVSINQNTKAEASEIINSIRDAIQESNLPTKDDVYELLDQIHDDIQSDRQPHKGVLTALKTLCSGGATVIPLVTALINLLSKF